MLPEKVESLILLIRGRRVMLDADLARLYGVPTKSLNLAARRNPRRFPLDFMFQLTKTELGNLRFQIETSRWGGRRYPPRAFTEQGVAMLSSVLRSERAVLVNIMIMRAFVKLRGMSAVHKDLARKLSELERRVAGHDENILSLFSRRSRGSSLLRQSHRQNRPAASDSRLDRRYRGGRYGTFSRTRSYLR